MTPNENAAFRAGIRHAADMALVTALAIEIRPDANHIRQQAAIAALQGLAEALKVGAPLDPRSTNDRRMLVDAGQIEHRPADLPAVLSGATSEATPGPSTR